MKKLLLLVGLLVVAGSAFAAEAGNVGESGEAQIDVKAVVVPLLAIEKVNDLDFGLITPLSEKIEEIPGKFTITGSRYTNVKILAKDLDPKNTLKYQEVPGTINVKLYQNGASGGAFNEQMDSSLAFYFSKDNAPVNGQAFSLAQMGSNVVGGNSGEAKSKADILVKGTLKSTRDGQNYGAYTGKLGVKAIYDNPALSTVK